MKKQNIASNWTSKLCIISAVFALNMPSVASAHEHIGARQDQLAHADSLWPTNDIPVCWQNPSPRNIEGRAWVRDAVENSWAMVSNVHFSGWAPCRAGFQGIKVRIADEQPRSTALGYGLVSLSEEMVLNFDFQNWDRVCLHLPEYCIRVNAVHEFGHALGFNHEPNSTGRADCDIRHEAEPTYLITPRDPLSVMNHCFENWGNAGRLSNLDVAGIRAVYGPYSQGNPLLLDFFGQLHITDDESSSRPHHEMGRHEIRGQLRITRPDEVAIFRREYCTGGEVRVVVDIQAFQQPGTPHIGVHTDVIMYEGTSCSTTDFEDRSSDFVQVKTLPISKQFRLENTELFGGDMAHLDITFFRGGRGVRVASSQDSVVCDSDCATIARQAHYLPGEMRRGEQKNKAAFIMSRLNSPSSDIVAHQGRNGRDNQLANICAQSLQGQVAWDYEGSKDWSDENLERVCGGNPNTIQSAKCFEQVMHGGLNWGGGTNWIWQNAAKLCYGTPSAENTITCFQEAITKGTAWSEAIEVCENSVGREYSADNVLPQRPEMEAITDQATAEIDLIVPEQDRTAVTDIASQHASGVVPEAIGVVRGICAQTLQGQIARDYQGSVNWSDNDIRRLCQGAANSSSPARCFERVMYSGVSWGGGTRWQPDNVFSLCRGTTNYKQTILCFKRDVAADIPWDQAINNCRAN